jgi:hypothetical protein
MNPGSARRFRVLAGWVLTLAIFGVLAPSVIHNFRSVREALGVPEILPLLLGVVGLIAYFVLRAGLWYALTDSCTPRPNIAASSRIWFLTEFARYLPGNVWSFLGRVGAMRVMGVPAAQSTAALVREAATTVATSGVLLPVLRRFEGSGGSAPLDVVTNLAGIFSAIVIVLLLLPVRVRTDPPRTRARIASVVLGLSAWIAFGWGSAGVLRAFHAALPLTSLVYASIAAWLLGYLSLLTPSGLGVREAAFQLHLANAYGVPAAIGTALGLSSRVLITAVEGVLVLCVLVLFRDPLSTSRVHAAASPEPADPSGT